MPLDMQPGTRRQPRIEAPALIDRHAALRLIGGCIVLTLVINAVGLVSPLFFAQVYDRVLTTGSVPTLLVLTLVALVAIGLGAAIEQWRTVTFARLGAGIYADLEGPVFRATHAFALNGGHGRRSRPLDDLESVRQALSGPLPGALLDLVFAPIIIVVLFLVHVWLGLFALGTLVVMGAVTTLTQWTIAGSLGKAAEAAQSASSVAESHLRSAEAAHAMGYADQALARWAGVNRDAVKIQIASLAQAGGLTSLGRAIRTGAQILVIAIAASLALTGQISPGVIIAASILLGRLLAPVDALLGGWRQLAQARLAAERLRALLHASETPQSPLVARPSGQLVVDGLFAMTQEGGAILRGVSFSVTAGETVAILGRTGAGKSTLLRCIVGVWPRMAGVVRLDGVPITDVDRHAIGPWLGFLPQTSELGPGTIAENIARFTTGDPAAVQSAVRMAGAEALIAALPQRYDTLAGEAGASLSAGQRRRIALARALYGSPCLVCLDEPEANLDRDGEIALMQALQALKAAGVTVLITAHRPSIVTQVDKVLILNEGRVAQFGPASEVLPMVATGNVRRVAQ